MNKRERAVYLASELEGYIIMTRKGQPINSAYADQCERGARWLLNYANRHLYPCWHPRRWSWELRERLPHRFHRWVPFLLVLGVGLGSCRAPGAAVRTLEGAGYSSVRLTGAAVGCCADRPLGDSFEAVAPDGLQVRGCVCRYLWGSPVIRVNR